MVEHFWRGWEKYKQPTLVSFNGRTFDIPLLELSAFRFGLSIPGWFNLAAKSFEQHRNRYNLDAHFDLQELLTNFGSTRFTGGLNLAANLLGKPGKMDVEGNMVQDMFDAGKLAEINDYCRCDVLDTYFVFLRTRVLLGEITLADEQRLISGETVAGRQGRAIPAFAQYLSSLGRLDQSMARRRLTRPPRPRCLSEAAVELLAAPLDWVPRKIPPLKTDGPPRLRLIGHRRHKALSPAQPRPTTASRCDRIRVWSN